MLDVCFRVWDSLTRSFVYEGSDVSEYVDSPRFVVEQFSGRRDKFNRRIFAGDLLGSSVEDSLWVVAYSEELTAFTMSHDGKTLLLNDFSDVEVISNIHSNDAKVSFVPSES